jgi:hypothetical protein
MKTYRQQLRDWLNNKKETTQNEVVNNFINELQKQIKSMEKIEEDMVNHSYIKGFHDSENKRGYNGNHYKTTYKQHDVLKGMLKHNFK